MLCYPFIQHGEKDELERQRFSARTPSPQHLRKQHRLLDADDLFRPWMHAVLGRRNHKVFATAKRPYFVDRAAFFFEEWARNTEREVLEPERMHLFALERKRGFADALCDATLLQSLCSLP